MQNQFETLPQVTKIINRLESAQGHLSQIIANRLSACERVQLNKGLQELQHIITEMRTAST